MARKAKLPDSSIGMFKIIYSLSAICFLLLAAAYFFEFNKPANTFYARLNDRAQPIKPLYEPNVSSKALLSWATLAATTAYTMDFVTYKETLESLREYFTVAGYDDYLQSLDASERLSDIIEQKLLVSAVVTGTPVILQEGMIKGIYTWRIQFPMLVSYQGASENSYEEKLYITLLITRVPVTEASKGIGIEQITAKPFFG